MALETKCRKEVLKNAIECAKSMEGPFDVTTGGDHNQEIASNEVHQGFA